MNLLPEKTVERLSQYRRTLLKTYSDEKQHIYSHEIASILHLTPVQVKNRPYANRLFRFPEKRL